ncbi:PorP/SprF family type IX secretion system membrane protein [Bacteroidota bacterium]
MKYQAKIKILFFIVSFLNFNSLLNGQSYMLYSKVDVYEFAVNPAASGRAYYPYLNLSFKKQWLGIKNSPFTTGIGGCIRMGTFDFYRPNKMLNKSIYKNKGRIGIGALMLHDINGPLKTSNYVATVSYFIPFKESELSFGLASRFGAYSIDYSVLSPGIDNDPMFSHSEIGSVIPEFDFGIYYHTHQFYTGISINELIKKHKLFFLEDETNNTRDAFFLSGYKFFLLYFDFEPAIYLGMINKDELYYNFRAKVYYRSYNWIALSYKTHNILCFSFGARLNKMYFAYSFEQNVSRVAKYNFGTHELMLGMNIGLFEAEGIRKRKRKYR